MRRIVWLGAVCLVVIFLVGTYNVLASNVLHGKVTGRSLYKSVENEVGVGALLASDHEGCRRAAEPGRWECFVADAEGSGDVAYTVRIHAGSSCWDGTGGGAGRPERISGCVHLQE